MYVLVILLSVSKILCISCVRKPNKKFSQSIKISGKKGGGGVWDSGVGVSGDASPPTGATATKEVDCAGTSRHSGGSTSLHSTVVMTMAAPPSRGGSHGCNW